MNCKLSNDGSMELDWELFEETWKCFVDLNLL